MKTTSDYIKDECIVLLDRMFTGQSLTFFGEDGNGQYGTSTFPVVARIRSFVFEIDVFSDDAAEVEAYVRIFLDGYDAAVTGFAITDTNLRINLNNILDDWDTDRATLDWADVGMQGQHSITLRVDIGKLLSW